MSTMLSDKVEQVGGAVGAAGGLSSVETGAGGRPSSDLHADFRRWKDEVLSAIDHRLAGTQRTAPYDRVPAASGRYQSGRYQTADAVAGVQEAVQADAREFGHQIGEYVVEHPLKAVAIAAGAGFLLGVLWSR